MYVPGNDVSLYFRFFVIAIMIFLHFCNSESFSLFISLLGNKYNGTQAGKTIFSPASPACPCGPLLQIC